MTTAPYTVVLHKNSEHQSFGIYIGDDVPSGIYIVTVEQNSPAGNSNIQPGDRVLAVNGQLVSSMSTHARETVTQIAKTAESLTLHIEPSDLLKSIDLPLSNNSQHTEEKKQNGIDRDLENYIKSIFGNQNLHIAPSSNHNEYILTTDSNLSQPRRHRHRHRKGHSNKKLDTQPAILDGQQENNPPLFRQRSIPSMGTSQVILRNTQLNSKDNEIHEFSEIKSGTNISPSLTNSDYNHNEKVIPHPEKSVISAITSASYAPHISNTSMNTLPNQQSSMINGRSSPMNNGNLREIRISRRPNFNGFGYHLQYNKLYYIIHQVEPNSPAEQSGLRNNDIILKLNNQPIDKMPHKTFVQIVNASTEIILLVQTYDDYVRDNPQVTRQPPSRQITQTSVNTNNSEDKRQNPFSKALTKLKSR